MLVACSVMVGCGQQLACRGIGVAAAISVNGSARGFVQITLRSLPSGWRATRATHA